MFFYLKVTVLHTLMTVACQVDIPPFTSLVRAAQAEAGTAVKCACTSALLFCHSLPLSYYNTLIATIHCIFFFTYYFMGHFPVSFCHLFQCYFC